MVTVIKYLLFLFISISSTTAYQSVSIALETLPNEKVLKLAEPYENYTQEVLDNILIPRIVGTENHEKVYNYLVNELETSKYAVETDEFASVVPIFGQLTFKNIIATLNPHADRFLVLACHYDSKYFPDEVFLGATDSAVPCAMLLNIARTLDLNKYRDNDVVSLKLIFFDGEEAFDQWGPNDSIYGAKHLATKLHANAKTNLRGLQTNDIENMDVLILLDLIGEKNPTFANYFTSTQRWYARMSNIEDELYRLGLLQDYTRNYFPKRRINARIEDDHLPFLNLGVPILHLIPAPFPRFWHTVGDNRDIVHMPTVNNINLILKIFICEFMQTVVIEAEEKKKQGELPEKEL